MLVEPKLLQDQKLFWQLVLVPRLLLTNALVI